MFNATTLQSNMAEVHMTPALIALAVITTLAVLTYLSWHFRGPE